MYKISLCITGLLFCLFSCVYSNAQNGSNYATFFVTITDPGYEPTVLLSLVVV